MSLAGRSLLILSDNPLSFPFLFSHAEHAPCTTPTTPAAHARNPRRIHVLPPTQHYPRAPLLQRSCTQGLPPADCIYMLHQRCDVPHVWLRQVAGAESGVAGERVDITFADDAGRLAWGIDGDAFLPAQNQEDKVPGAVLGHRARLAGFIMAIRV
ncbi:uncharacterized protein M421DRAFT_417139 [Didymella exigua CBS 183.55]|uniref:Uncharacterized protein n=1 Tax=Didymella exigua CBS 183.55 TaxID=1150837 RepID=A0A6A5RY20_9PLEO|nr:uncharacterized protein M421DRAFT_417139 [Didymella exigua CBS 183.55]KAF1932419.1 hypothetical protein M421DRAFT_417139 [Didymella exigua CBS 183.55]